MLMRAEPAPWFDQFAWSGSWSRPTPLAVDVIRADGEFVVIADPPGVRADAVDIDPAELTAEFDVDVEFGFHRALRDYLAATAEHLGLGLESCTVDWDLPTSAYLAVNRRLPDFPDRDLALLWDEVHGWAAAIETHSGEDLIVVSYLDTTTVTSSPALVGRFLRDLCSGRSGLGRPDPPTLRVAGDHPVLAGDLDAAAEQF